MRHPFIAEQFVLHVFVLLLPFYKNWYLLLLLIVYLLLVCGSKKKTD
jgi:hypothetical protein